MRNNKLIINQYSGSGVTFLSILTVTLVSRGNEGHSTGRLTAVTFIFDLLWPSSVTKYVIDAESPQGLLSGAS